MADKITETRTIAIGFQWTDTNLQEKVTYIKFPNPKPTVSKEAINDIFNALAGNQTYPAILLDKNGQRFDKWTDAYTETTVETIFDIGIES